MSSAVTERDVWKHEALPLIWEIQDMLQRQMVDDMAYHAKGRVLTLSVKWQDVSVLVDRLKKLKEIIQSQEPWDYKHIVPHIRDQLSWAEYLLEVEREQT